MIRVENLYKEYSPTVKVLFNINFTFESSKTYAIIGSSGGGKSTLIRCLNMLEEPTSGSIYFNNIKINDPSTNLAQVREKVGMVFQNFNLFEHMKALDNVTYALRKVKHMSKKKPITRGKLSWIKLDWDIAQMRIHINYQEEKSNDVPLLEHLRWNLKYYCLMNRQVRWIQR